MAEFLCSVLLKVWWCYVSRTESIWFCFCFVSFTVDFKSSLRLFVIFSFSRWRRSGRLWPRSLPPQTSRGRQTSSLESLARTFQTQWTGGTKDRLLASRCRWVQTSSCWQHLSLSRLYRRCHLIFYTVCFWLLPVSVCFGEVWEELKKLFKCFF